MNQVAADRRDVLLFLPREYDVQFDADRRVVLLLPREYVVDGRGGYVEVDLDPCLPVAIGTVDLPLNRREAFAISLYIRCWCCCLPCML